MGEVAHMATNLTLSKANEAVGKIYAKYTDRLSDPAKGKPFNECYVVNSEYAMSPTDEYLTLYQEVLSEIKDYCF
jgi:methylamine--corrinoid protein Co-methyltransferase